MNGYTFATNVTERSTRSNARTGNRINGRSTSRDALGNYPHPVALHFTQRNRPISIR